MQRLLTAQSCLKYCNLYVVRMSTEWEDYWSGKVASSSLPGLWGQLLGTSVAYKLTLQLARTLLWHRWAPLAIGPMWVK